MIHEKYFEVLERVAIDVLPAGKQKLAALLVYRNDVIAIGTNKNKTHPLQKKYSKHDDAIFLHAEIDCIKNAIRNVGEDIVAKSTMYVLRVKKPAPRVPIMIRGMAKPCCGCFEAIKDYGIQSVYYTTDDGYELMEI